MKYRPHLTKCKLIHIAQFRGAAQCSRIEKIAISNVYLVGCTITSNSKIKVFLKFFHHSAARWLLQGCSIQNFKQH